jgi:hypothetical protein
LTEAENNMCLGESHNCFSSLRQMLSSQCVCVFVYVSYVRDSDVTCIMRSLKEVASQCTSVSI